MTKEDLLKLRKKLLILGLAGVMVGTAGCGKKNNDDDNENNITTYNKISPEKLHLDKCYKKIIKNGEAVKVYNSNYIGYLIDKDTYEVSVYLFYSKKSYGDIVSTWEIYTLPSEEVIYSNNLYYLSPDVDETMEFIEFMLDNKYDIAFKDAPDYIEGYSPDDFVTYEEIVDIEPELVDGLKIMKKSETKGK